MKFQTKVRTILINAAKMIASGKEHYSCCAIWTASRNAQVKAGDHNSDAGNAAESHYRSLFSPRMFGDGRLRFNPNGRGRKPFGSAPYWNVGPGEAKPEVVAQHKQMRIAALLAAAASYEA